MYECIILVLGGFFCIQYELCAVNNELLMCLLDVFPFSYTEVVNGLAFCSIYRVFRLISRSNRKSWKLWLMAFEHSVIFSRFDGERSESLEKSSSSIAMRDRRVFERILVFQEIKIVISRVAINVRFIRNSCVRNDWRIWIWRKLLVLNRGSVAGQ